jgi:L-fucose mutarotase/ribose pyranase (RbsD/FucU family)
MTVRNDDVNRGLSPLIWGTYQDIAYNAEEKDVPVPWLERFAFYERAEKAYAVVSTG